jgi:tetratricopeptide (TPR) repeat protein
MGVKERRGDWVPNFLAAGSLCLIVLLIYYNSFSNGFTNWDDENGIINNPYIRSLSWQNVKLIFTPGAIGSYQPLRTLSLAVDYHFWKLNPAGYHATNVFFYVLTCITVFFGTQRLLAFLRGTKDDRSNFRVALFASLLFAVHPIHVEAVTWVSARKEVLLAFFFFLSLYLYLRAKGITDLRHRVIFYTFAFVAFVAASLSKPTAVVLPLVLVFFELCRGRREAFSVSLRKVLLFLPFVIVSLYLSYLLIGVMRGMGGIKEYWGGSLSSNLLLVPHIYLHYIKLMALTINYSNIYTLIFPYPVWCVKTMLYILGNAAILTWAVFAMKRAPVTSFGIFWFYVTILPVSNIIPISTMLADRYAFLASFSFCLILGLAFERLYRMRHALITPQFFRVLSTALLALLVGGYSYMTVQQNRIWKNTHTLWADAAAKSPDNHIALSMLGVVYIDAQMYEEAEKLLERAAEKAPDDQLVLTNLGIVYFHLGRYEDAYHAYQKALSRDPYLREAHINLANLFVKVEDYGKAEQVYQHYLEKHDADAQCHYFLGNVYLEAGQYEEAKVQFERAAELESHIVAPYRALAELFLDHFNDKEQALAYLRKAADLARGTEREEEINRMIEGIIQEEAESRETGSG